MNGQWIIRKANLDDVETIARFNIAMALETEAKILDPATITRGVHRLLENPDLGFYLIAESKGLKCGSLMITYEWTDWRDGLFWWIQSVYVDPLFRRQGLFRELFRYVTTEAVKGKDIRGVRLYVEKDNTGARQTYQSLGMGETHYRLYEMEFETVINLPGAERRE